MIIEYSDPSGITPLHPGVFCMEIYLVGKKERLLYHVGFTNFSAYSARCDAISHRKLV